MLAYDYPILGVFWTILMVFVWVSWLFIFFRVIMDIFRSDDLSGWGKTGWLLLVVILPLIGVLIYVIARGQGMGERDLAVAKAQKADVDAYVRSVAGSGNGVADELQKLSQLRDQNVISESEFQAQKARLLS